MKHVELKIIVTAYGFHKSMDVTYPKQETLESLVSDVIEKLFIPAKGLDIMVSNLKDSEGK